MAKGKFKIILIISILAILVASFSISAVVINHKKEQNPEVATTSAAGSANDFATRGFTITGDINPTQDSGTRLDTWRSTYLQTKTKNNGLFGAATTSFDNWYEDQGVFSISTYEDMVMFALSCEWKDYYGKTVKLLSDINCGGRYLPAVGHTGWYLASTDSCAAFRGTFEGCGHTVSNFRLYNAKEDYGEHVLGFFYKLYNPGIIRDLCVRDAEYIVQGTREKTVCVGGLVGDAEQGCKIERCKVADISTSASVETVAKQSSSQAGALTFTRTTVNGLVLFAGIVGKISGYHVNGQLWITDCYVCGINNTFTYTIDLSTAYYGVNVDSVGLISLVTFIGPAFTDGGEGYYLAQRCVVPAGDFINEFTIKRSGFTQYITLTGAMGFTEDDDEYTGWSNVKHSTNNYSRASSVPGYYNSLGNETEMGKFSNGSSDSTWFYRPDFNGGFPCLRQFLPWTTYYFQALSNGTINGKVGNTTIFVPTNSLDINTSSSTIVNSFGFCINAKANPGFEWIRWEKKGDYRYEAIFSKSDYQVEFFPAVVEYYRYDSSTNQFYLDEDKTGELLYPQNAANDIIVLTMKADASIEWSDDTEAREASFSIAGNQVIYNYKSVYGTAAYLSPEDFERKSDTLYWGNIRRKVNGASGYGGNWNNENELARDDNGNFIGQVRPRIQVYETVLIYESTGPDYIYHNSEPYDNLRIGMGVYPGETGTLKFEIEKSLQMNSRAYIYINGSVKASIILRNSNQVITQLGFYLYNFKNNTVTREEINSSLNPPTYNIVGDVEIADIEINNKYKNLIFEDVENVDVKVYKYTNGASKTDVTTSFTNANGNIEFKNMVYTKSKLAYEETMGPLQDFPSSNKRIKLTYFFLDESGNSLRMDSSIYEHITYKVEYVTSGHYFISDFALINDNVNGLVDTEIDSIEDDYIIAPLMQALDVMFIEFTNASMFKIYTWDEATGRPKDHFSTGETVNFNVKKGGVTEYDKTKYEIRVYVDDESFKMEHVWDAVNGTLTYNISSIGINGVLQIIYSVPKTYYYFETGCQDTLTDEGMKYTLTPELREKDYNGEYTGPEEL